MAIPVYAGITGKSIVYWIPALAGITKL